MAYKISKQEYKKYSYKTLTELCVNGDVSPSLLYDFLTTELEHIKWCLSEFSDSEPKGILGKKQEICEALLTLDNAFYNFKCYKGKSDHIIVKNSGKYMLPIFDFYDYPSIPEYYYFHWGGNLKNDDNFVPMQATEDEWMDSTLVKRNYDEIDSYLLDSILNYDCNPIINKILQIFNDNHHKNYCVGGELDHEFYIGCIIQELTTFSNESHLKKQLEPLLEKLNEV